MDDVAWLEPEELVAWRRLMTLLHHLPTALGAALAPHDLNFFDYGVMAMLSDAPDRTLTMGRLAALTNASPSRVSHAARRLEGRGLIARATDPGDGRVTLATLTDVGLATMERVAPDHVASVRALVFDALDEDQVDQLATICGEVLRRIIPDLAPPWGGVDETW